MRAAALLALLTAAAGCAGAGAPAGHIASSATSRAAMSGGDAGTPARAVPRTGTPAQRPTPAPGVRAPARGGVPRRPLISTVRWVRRGNALRVVPTAALRAAPTTASARRAWREVLAAQPDADRPGMYDQFRCHVEYAPKKAAWYLDPGRPDLGYVVTVLAKCNPGPDRDGG